MRPRSISLEIAWRVPYEVCLFSKISQKSGDRPLFSGILPVWKFNIGLLKCKMSNSEKIYPEKQEIHIDVDGWSRRAREKSLLSFDEKILQSLLVSIVLLKDSMPKFITKIDSLSK